jgi:hypothetical protein
MIGKVPFGGRFVKPFFGGPSKKGARQISSAPSTGGEGRDEGGQLFAPKAPH